MEVRENGIKNFDDFYTIKVQPNIERFEKENQSAGSWEQAAALAGIATVISFLITQFTEYDWNGGWITAGLLVVSIYSIYKYTKKDDAYISDFKQSIIKEIIDYLQPGLKYDPDGMMPQNEYRQSGLYRWRHQHFEGDDYISGVYKGVSFHCSEIKAYVIRTGRYSEWDAVRGQDRDGNIFKGLFFAATVNSGYTGGTYVWIKGKEQLGASVADEAYRMFRFPASVHIHTGNALFDEYYSVYSTNPAEAHAIIDSEMMNNLIRFRNQLQRNVVFSVVLGKCYVAIPVKEDLFEPANNLDNREEIKKYFFSVLLILSIINQLNLSKLQ